MNSLKDAQHRLAEAQEELRYYYSDLQATEPDEDMERSLIREIASLEAEIEEKQWEENCRKEWQDPHRYDSALDPAFGSWREYYSFRF
jgi:hypothetical protein